MPFCPECQQKNIRFVGSAEEVAAHRLQEHGYKSRVSKKLYRCVLPPAGVVPTSTGLGQKKGYTN